VGVSQTLRRWIEGGTYIRQGGHHVRHWPTFELKFFCSRRQSIEILLNSLTITGRTVLLFRLNRGWHFETRNDAINWSSVWSRVLANNNVTMCVYWSLNDFCEFQLFICHYPYLYKVMASCRSIEAAACISTQWTIKRGSLFLTITLANLNRFLK